MTKNKQLLELFEDYKKEFPKEEIVSGDGNVHSRLMLIGEAPGKDEIRLSKPFVGIAGKNLAEFLDVLCIDRESIYITNAIKYRLSRINSKTGRTVNRPAAADEIKRSRVYLQREIGIIRPEYIVTLGNVPLRAVTCKDCFSIGTVHGILDKISVLDRQISLFPLYHPASIIYNRGLKEVYINDILKLKNIIMCKSMKL